MIKAFLIILISLIGFTLSGQNYARVDSIVKNYRGSFSNPKKLAMQINYNFASDSDKARAIYTWMATNIRYDYKKFKSKKKYITLKYKTQKQKNRKLQKLDEEKILNTFKKKKGICSDYSIVFQRLCNYCGLECKIISGSSKNENKRIGKKPGKSDHSWNAVKISNQWQLVDVTWGAGYVNHSTKKFTFNFEDLYYCTPPEKFFLNHFPKDTTFLFTNKSKEDFTNLPLYTNEFIKNSIAIFPKNGVINFQGHDEFIFMQADLKSLDELSYKYNNDRHLKKVQLQSEEVNKFKIPTPGKSISYLTIYLNNVSMVTYKIIKDR